MTTSRKLSAHIAANVFCILLLASADAFAQNADRAPLSPPPSQPQAQPAREMSPEEAQLVRASKQAILSTGITAPYFDAHFKLAQVFNSMSDRRVVWRFTTGEHEAMLTDSIGFYTDKRGRRVYTHTVGQTLASAHDIRRTITRRQAERIMKSCIGEFESSGVVYQATGQPPRAALVFTALSLPKPEDSAAPANNKTASAAPTTTPASAPSTSSASAAVSGAPQADIVKPGAKKKPFLLTGGVNLETGRCTKGLAQVGSPLPPRPERGSRTRQ